MFGGSISNASGIRSPYKQVLSVIQEWTNNVNLSNWTHSDLMRSFEIYKFEIIFDLSILSLYGYSNRTHGFIISLCPSVRCTPVKRAFKWMLRHIQDLHIYSANGLLKPSTLFKLLQLAWLSKHKAVVSSNFV